MRKPAEASQRMLEAVLDFWFGIELVDARAVRMQLGFWFRSAPEQDLVIADRFGRLLATAARGELDHCAERARARLALIILLDQFSRNIHRGTKQAFATDARALELTETGIDAGLDLGLEPIERGFFYMPLQHAESLDVQRRSVGIFEALSRSEQVAHIADALVNFAAFAREHHEIIVRFGRFPHRTSTRDEEAFLASGAPRFGQ
jgi:uncharacterized protein (DUF924 family)